MVQEVVYLAVSEGPWAAGWMAMDGEEAVRVVEVALTGVIAVALFHSSLTARTHGIIRNWCSLGLVGVGLAGQYTLWYLGAVDAGGAALTSAASLGIGVLLYVKKVWSAGDGKLYWGVVTALPPCATWGNPGLVMDGAAGAVLVNSLAIQFVVGMWRLSEGDGPYRGATSRRQYALIAFRAGVLGSACVSVVTIAARFLPGGGPRFGDMMALSLLLAVLVEDHMRSASTIGASLGVASWGLYQAATTRVAMVYGGLVLSAAVVMAVYLSVRRAWDMGAGGAQVGGRRAFAVYLAAGTVATYLLGGSVPAPEVGRWLQHVPARLGRSLPMRRRR